MVGECVREGGGRLWWESVVGGLEKCERRCGRGWWEKVGEGWEKVCRGWKRVGEGERG